MDARDLEEARRSQAAEAKMERMRER
jgi:hypothetical protein